MAGLCWMIKVNPIKDRTVRLVEMVNEFTLLGQAYIHWSFMFDSNDLGSVIRFRDQAGWLLLVVVLGSFIFNIGIPGYSSLMHLIQSCRKKNKQKEMTTLSQD